MIYHIQNCNKSKTAIPTGIAVSLAFSLRWHYPNQVWSEQTSSLSAYYCKLPYFHCNTMMSIYQDVFWKFWCSLLLYAIIFYSLLLHCYSTYDIMLWQRNGGDCFDSLAKGGEIMEYITVILIFTFFIVFTIKK